MNDADRSRLLGSYRTPRCRIGQRVRCLVRGEVVIASLSTAPIPWPMCRRGCRRDQAGDDDSTENPGRQRLPG